MWSRATQKANIGLKMTRSKTRNGLNGGVILGSPVFLRAHIAYELRTELHLLISMEIELAQGFR